VLGESQHLPGFLERLVEHPAPADQLKPANVLSLKPKHVEGVEARRGLSVAEQAVEAWQSLYAVRHGLAVEHDALERQRAHGGGDCYELGRPVPAVATTDERCRRP
jgi:hypothetical protein